ncbi:hypothetical protein MTO96_049177 [Rhipicephalus appendiculatus]
MSGESSLVCIRNSDTKSNVLTRRLSKENAGAALVALFFLGVFGVVGVLTFVMFASKDDVADELTSVAVNAVPAVPAAPPRGHPTPSREESRHLRVHPKQSASLSADKLAHVVRKRGKKRNAARKASRASTFAHRTGVAAVDDNLDDDAVEKDNSTTVLEKDALIFVQDEDDDSRSYASNVLNGNETEKEPDKDALSNVVGRDTGTTGLFSSIASLSGPSARMTAARATAEISASVSKTLEPNAPPTNNVSSSTTISPVHLTRKTNVLGLTAGDDTKRGSTMERIARPSSSRLFCFYDDRSTIRSPGFSVYDFPVHLCTDVAFCCVDVSAQGRVIVSKSLKLFLQVLGHEFLPASHLYVTLGGHRVLIHHLDAALQNTARFATELTEQVKRLGVGGLAVYLEDVELLKHAFRVHDLIMAVRDLAVAVVLPRELRQQVRYYHTEIYANTKDMLVISPPSQGYGSKTPRPRFATCPHPRRSVHEGSSLEFIYQLSRTLLYSTEDGSADYTSTNVGTAQKQPPPPRYLIGVSFGGLKFQLMNRSLHDVGSPATFVRALPYREICKQPWRRWHDNVSECFRGVGWRSGLDVFTGTRKRRLSRRRFADGLAVFDLDYDDHSGECGDKYPVLEGITHCTFFLNVRGC